MKSTIILLIAAIALPALANSDPLHKGGFQYKDSGAAPGKDDSLYQALGGSEKIAAFTKDFVTLIFKDEQIGKFFTRVNADRLARKLTAQFIELSGGPAGYDGGDMTDVHESLGITTSDFNKLAEDLQFAMDKHDVPFATQNRLVALLAPMQRAIVTK